MIYPLYLVILYILLSFISCKKGEAEDLIPVRIEENGKFSFAYIDGKRKKLRMICGLLQHSHFLMG